MVRRRPKARTPSNPPRERAPPRAERLRQGRSGNRRKNARYSGPSCRPKLPASASQTTSPLRGACDAGRPAARSGRDSRPSCWPQRTAGTCREARSTGDFVLPCVRRNARSIQPRSGARAVGISPIIRNSKPRAPSIGTTLFDSTPAQRRNSNSLPFHSKPRHYCSRLPETGICQEAGRY